MRADYALGLSLALAALACIGVLWAADKFSWGTP
jgi:hypothetical protein